VRNTRQVTAEGCSYKAQKSLEGIETKHRGLLPQTFPTVTKHRNPWKGLKHGGFVDDDAPPTVLQSTEIPGRD